MSAKVAAVKRAVASQRLSGIDARHHWDDDPELAAAAHEMADRLDALEEAERAASLIALRAFGEAIATVARARLVSRVMDARTVVVRLHDGRELELWWYGAELCLSEYEHNRAPRRPRTFAGQPEDIAAEAVARLLAEVGL